ncbi:MAG: Stp1/IreP family PP2C-type Ser/Thr phosphatase [Deltaproteobacteria bacterium]|nr:MAG: Stp1/IreP family PP2C-type Ser/Thr phosphatase [Deltaproteobacteria bacterium]
MRWFIEEGAMTDVGRKRELNEDNYLVAPDYGLYLVADGMGGHSAGEIASEMAVFSISEFIEKTSQDREITWPFQREERYSDDANRLIVATKLANQHVWNRGQSQAKYHGMGTTIVAAFVSGDRVYISHVGDSRVYRIRDRQIEQLTEDHSLLADHIRMHKLTEEEAANFPFKNVITRALGVDEEVEVDIQEHPLQPDDVYLLCSDGLSGLVKDQVILQIVLENLDDLDEACRRLIAAANANGGPDNITVVIFRTRYLPEAEALRLQKAREAMKHAYPRTPTNQAFHLKRAAAARVAEQTEPALHDVQQKVEQKLTQARSALAQKQYKEAVSLLKQVALLEPEHEEGQRLLAEAEHQLAAQNARRHETDPALRARRVVELLEAGKGHLSEKAFAKAEECFLEVQRLDPTNEEAQALLARTLASLQEAAEEDEATGGEERAAEAFIEREAATALRDRKAQVEALDPLVRPAEEAAQEILSLDPSFEEAEILEELEEIEQAPRPSQRSAPDLEAEERAFYEAEMAAGRQREKAWEEHPPEGTAPPAEARESAEAPIGETGDEALEAAENPTLQTPLPSETPQEERPTIQVLSPFAEVQEEAPAFDDILSLDVKEKLAQVKEHFRIGLKCMEEEEYERAIHHWKIVRTLDAEEQTRYHRNAKVLIKIATMKLRERTQPLLDQAKRHYQKGELYKAWMILKRVLDEYPDHKEARRYFNLTQENLIKLDKVGE